MSLFTALVSYWKLDEASGTRFDSHGGNHLTDNDTVDALAGKIGLAAAFFGNPTEYLNHAQNSDLQTGDIDFTISCWVLLGVKATLRGIITRDSLVLNGREYFLYYDSTPDRFLFVTSNGGGPGLDQLNQATALTLGSPTLAVAYHIVCWHDSTANTTNIQVNNGAVDSVTDTYVPAVAAASPQFVIGGFDNASSRLPHNGRVDEVGFWKRVLTPAERAELYNSGNGLAYPFPVAGVDGTGALVAQRAIVAGAGVSRSTGAGVLVAQAASLAGVGSAFSVTAGTGALVVTQRALVSGVGTSRSPGTGVLAAQSATLAGTGAAQGAGMGVLAARNAVIVGTGTIGLATVSGAGVLAAGTALVTGTGVTLAVATGQGALVAGQASLSATGTSETTGTGALVARAATLVGQFIVTTGAGILNARRATVAGTGTTTGDSSSVDFEGDLVDVIGPLVGGRAYPNTYPQDCIWPAIRYTLVSIDPADDLCSHAEEEDGTETSDVRVQFDLVAETYTQSRDLRVAMRKAMRGFDPPALMSAEFNTYDTETKVHRVVMDYVFYPSSD